MNAPPKRDLGLVQAEAARFVETLSRLTGTSEPQLSPTRPVAALPEAGTVAAITRAMATYNLRRVRAKVFPAQDDLFGEPAWDILLILFIEGEAHRKPSISSVCIAADVPPTTALRWIRKLVDLGYLDRSGDPDDGRRSFLNLTSKAHAAMLKLFNEIRS